MPGGVDRRIGVLESLVERRVEEELEAVLCLLEERLPKDDYVRILRIVAGREKGEEQ